MENIEVIIAFGGVVLVAFVIIAVLLLRQKKAQKNAPPHARGKPTGAPQSSAGAQPGGPGARGGRAAGGSSGTASGAGRSTSGAGRRSTSGAGRSTSGVGRTTSGAGRSPSGAGATRQSSQPAPSSQTESGEGMRYNWVVGRTAQMRGKAFHIGDKMASIGRGVANYIQVADEAVSQRHALLIGTDYGIQVTDMNSSNGTFVNGREIGENEEVNLEDGDEIKVGETVFVFERQGDYENAAHTQEKKVDSVAAGKTKAMSVDELTGGGGGQPQQQKGDLSQQVLAAVAIHDGDYHAAAEHVGLDVDILEQIVEKARRRKGRS